MQCGSCNDLPGAVVQRCSGARQPANVVEAQLAHAPAGAEACRAEGPLSLQEPPASGSSGADPLLLVLHQPEGQIAGLSLPLVRGLAPGASVTLQQSWQPLPSLALTQGNCFAASAQSSLMGCLNGTSFLVLQSCALLLRPVSTQLSTAASTLTESAQD